MTWFNNTVVNKSNGISFNVFQSELVFNKSWNASLVGANTVNGPGPCNVVIKSALINAAARELKPLATATSTTL